MTHLHPVSALVHNEPGVLARVAGLLSRRGFNIESLAVGETHNPKFSRMIIVVRGDDATIEQVIKQVARLTDVVKVVDVGSRDNVELELALIKVRPRPEVKDEVERALTEFGAEVMDRGGRSVIASIVCEHDRLEALIDALRPFSITELTRSGRLVMARVPRPNGKPESAEPAEDKNQ